MGHKLTLRLRQGGEKLKPGCDRQRKTLKNLLQESGTPPWQRTRLPLLYCNDILVAVPGVGIACGYQAESDEVGLYLRWRSLYTD